MFQRLNNHSTPNRNTRAVMAYADEYCNAIPFLPYPVFIMPELPEVEVTRRGVAPHLDGRTVTAVTLRHTGLRWPFPPDLPARLCGHTIRSIGRRGKYLLIGFDHGTLIVHL